MANVTLFLNSFLSYMLVFCVIIIVGAIAMFLGITLRKKKNAQEQAAQTQDDQTV